MPLLTSVLPFNDYDFYLCGPPTFMQSIYDGLTGLNVADAQIHAEAFGPASLVRKSDASKALLLGTPARTSVPVPVHALGQGSPLGAGSGTLLELAEARGLSPEFSCRLGNCGSMPDKDHRRQSRLYQNADRACRRGRALICCSVQAAATEGDEGQLLQLDL